jgi:hypothetical protein
MKKACLWLVVTVLAAFAAGRAADPEEERKAKLAELDAACEVAREEKLVPLRVRYVEECVEKEQRADRAACERFYADYGNGAGNRRLFYDLPECEKAFEYRRSAE